MILLTHVIRDEKLKAALNERYFNQQADQEITKNQLASLKGAVYLEKKEIKDLTGINYAINLTGLYLSLIHI